MKIPLFGLLLFITSIGYAQIFQPTRTITGRSKGFRSDDMVFTSDNKFAYSASWAHGLCSYKRNADGSLTAIDCIQAKALILSPGNDQNNSVYSIVLSKDEKFLYASARYSGEVMTYTRDVATGRLSWIQGG